MSERGLHDRTMFVFFGAGFAGQPTKVAIALGGFEQLSADRHEPARPTTGDQGDVKLSMRVLPGRATNLSVGDIKSRRPKEAMKGTETSNCSSQAWSRASID